jgi:hypothetical protein
MLFHLVRRVIFRLPAITRIEIAKLSEGQVHNWLKLAEQANLE